MQRLGPKKKEKEKKWVCDCFGHGTVLVCWTERGLFTRDGCLKKLTQQGVVSPKNLFLSLNLWRKDLVPQKKGKGKAVSVWFSWSLDCLYALNREWALYKRWVTETWPPKASPISTYVPLHNRCLWAWILLYLIVYFFPTALGPGRKSGDISSNGFLDQLPMCPR